MLIVAHRGGSPEHLDNSADAFSAGIEAGADLLECDLQRSANGDIVLYHDTRFFGAPISEFTTDELRGLILSILTFDEFLEMLATSGSDIRLVLDLKTRDVDRALTRYLDDPALRSRVLVTSTFALGLYRLRRRYPQLRLGLSRGATFTRIPPRLRPLASATVGWVVVVLAVIQIWLLRIDTIALQHDLIDRRTVAFFRDRHFRVDAWTIDTSVRVRELQELGVDYVTTNRPLDIIPGIVHQRH